jgi:hypothetical protein
MGGLNRMADDRMKHDDAQRNMGTKGNQDFGQQSPGRSGQSGQQGGQHVGGQQGGSQQGSQKGAQNLDDDDEFDTGKSSGQNRGGQNR